MKTIKTQSNSIIVVEVPGEVINWQSLDVVLDWSKHKILGKLSELEDNELERFCHKIIQNDPPDQEIKFRGNWYNYLDYNKYESSPKQSFISLLQSEGIDTNKELLIIEVL